MNTLLYVQHLSKEFGNAVILHDIDFELKENDFAAIMGPSGSGKSTFLNMISGMDKPTRGEVYYLDQSIIGLNDKQMSSFRLEKMGIADKEAEAINHLSGGQLQRGCICRAMINNPAVLFADEPTGALNRQAAAQVMKSFENLHSEGATILLVTHDFYVAAHADRVIYLADGKIMKELKFDKEMDITQRHKTISEWVLAS